MERVAGCIWNVMIYLYLCQLPSSLVSLNYSIQCVVVKLFSSIELTVLLTE